jgi:hypothetical protein
VLLATDVAVGAATQSALSEVSAGVVKVAVAPELVSVPHPAGGVRLQVTPALVGSFVTVAVSVTGELPALIVVEDPDWAIATLTAWAIGEIEKVTAADLVPSVTEVAVTVTLQLLLTVMGGV